MSAIINLKTIKPAVKTNVKILHKCWYCGRLTSNDKFCSTECHIRWKNEHNKGLITNEEFKFFLNKFKKITERKVQFVMYRKKLFNTFIDEFEIRQQAYINLYRALCSYKKEHGNLDNFSEMIYQKWLKYLHITKIRDRNYNTRFTSLDGFTKTYKDKTGLLSYDSFLDEKIDSKNILQDISELSNKDNNVKHLLVSNIYFWNNQDKEQQTLKKKLFPDINNKNSGAINIRGRARIYYNSEIKEKLSGYIDNFSFLRSPYGINPYKEKTYCAFCGKERTSTRKGCNNYCDDNCRNNYRQILSNIKTAMRKGRLKKDEITPEYLHKYMKSSEILSKKYNVLLLNWYKEKKHASM